MLRITTTYRLAETGAYILRVAGRLEDNWVQELRRSWRPLQNAVAGVSIRVDAARDAQTSASQSGGDWGGDGPGEETRGKPRRRTGWATQEAGAGRQPRAAR